MISDRGDLEELHGFAAKIGLRREWYQTGRGHDHYDLTTKRKLILALKHGAVLCHVREIVVLLKMQNEQRRRK